jgi:BirA family biotin operon repressor/biotin-[acetyl-CoA-carboxylase] ligase
LGIHDYALIRRLADGRCHSLLQLAADLNIDPDLAASALDRLADKGLQFQRFGQDGYCLTHGFDVLDPAIIGSGLVLQAREFLESVEVLEQVDSTNSWLLQQPRCEPSHGRACLAELQREGRGRRGRLWIAPPGGSLCLSLAWHLESIRTDISSLGLVCSVAVVRALEAFGTGGLGLKWPNDLVWEERKLGGVLVEMRSSGGGSGYAVIGLGLNLHLGDRARTIPTGWGGPPTDLTEILGRRLPGRNALAAELLNSLVRGLKEFSGKGFVPTRPDWERLDVLRDRQVTVQGETGSTGGIAMGVDDRGALKLRVGRELVLCVDGEVSVRPENATTD